MFIARANMEGVLTPGKCGHHPHGAHIPYGGKEQIVRQTRTSTWDVPSTQGV